MSSFDKDIKILILFSLFGLLIFLLFLTDIIIDLELSIIFIFLNILLIFFLLIYLINYYQKRTKLPLSIEEFEKTLQGGLYHFKCQVCNGIFAIKKSKKNNDKPVKMTCPDCGAVGIIPKNPKCIIENIPEKKSLKANFRCFNCGEGITVWAEGTHLFCDTKVYSCPFCGIDKALKKF